jgi:hypothetical protein
MNAPLEERLRTITHILQTDPGAYRAFGIYWWTLKRWLAQYHDQATLYFLAGRTTDDPPCRHHVERLFDTPDELLRAAVQHYNTKVELGERYDGNTYFPDDDETYRLHDPDLGPANIRA